MSEDPLARWRRVLLSEPALQVIAVLTALAAAALFAYMGHLRPPQSHIWGDEGTYLAMTASLARDADLTFRDADRDWAIERGNEKGVAVILERDGERITYSKPILYPLLAAPFYKLLGEPGLLVLNAVALAIGLFFVLLYLRRLGRGGRLWLTWVVFAGCAALVPYVAWRMSEALQVGLVMSGLALVLGGLPRKREQKEGQLRNGEEAASSESVPGFLDRLLVHPLAPWIGGALLGLVVSMRSSNAILAAGAVLASLLAAGWRRAAAVTAGAAVALLLLGGATLVTLGSVNPYLAQRSSFNAEIGYPTGATDPAAARFDENPATHHAYLEVSDLSLWSAYYYLVGRHTGLLAYFPLALGLVFWLLRRPDRVGLVMLASVLALAAFYLLYMPQNYFGGATFLGNRYFLIAYPALLLAIRRLPPPTLLVGSVVVASLFGGSAAMSVRRTQGLDATSQSHTAAGLFELLPYESTAREIEGQKSRFWSRDYVRFLDSFADVDRHRFVLHEDRPPTQIMIASRLPRDRLVFLVQAGNRRAVFDWKDWARSGWIPLEGNPWRRGGLVDFRPATPWRSHPFAFKNDETYDVRVLELAVHSIEQDEGGDTEPIQAEVYYLGSDIEIFQATALRVLAERLPRQGVAGGSSTIVLRLRNQSKVTWQTDAVLPIMAGVKLYRNGKGPPEVQRFPLPHDVPTGTDVELRLPVRWPEEPGRYRLEVDLAIYPLHWFSERREEPVAVGRVVVEAPTARRRR